MSTIAIIRPEGIYYSAYAPHFCGLFNTPESAGENSMLNGATGWEMGA